MYGGERDSFSFGELHPLINMMAVTANYHLPLRYLCWREGTRKGSPTSPKTRPSQQSLKRAPRMNLIARLPFGRYQARFLLQLISTAAPGGFFFFGFFPSPRRPAFPLGCLMRDYIIAPYYDLSEPYSQSTGSSSLKTRQPQAARFPKPSQPHPDITPQPHSFPYPIPSFACSAMQCLLPPPLPMRRVRLIPEAAVSVIRAQRHPLPPPPPPPMLKIAKCRPGLPPTLLPGNAEEPNAANLSTRSGPP